MENDVKEALRQLVLPEGALSDRYDIRISEAALESFDAVVSKATCSANIRVTDSSGAQIADTTMAYTVKPSAQNAEQFVIQAPSGFLKAQLTNNMATVDAAEAQAQQEAAAHSALLAIVTPRWLLGRWVAAGYGADACAGGPFVEFKPKYRFATADTEGTWRLTGDSLVYANPNGENAVTITNANADSFAETSDQGETNFYRRCGEEELPAAPSPTAQLPRSTPDASAYQ